MGEYLFRGVLMRFYLAMKCYMIFVFFNFVSGSVIMSFGATNYNGDNHSNEKMMIISVIVIIVWLNTS